MNYELIKAAVAAVIKENGNEEITGNILQQSLLAIINVLGIGYQYMGIATPTTDPGTPDAREFYFAAQEGAYSNFNTSPITELDGRELAIFYYDTAWHVVMTGVATRDAMVGYAFYGEPLASGSVITGIDENTFFLVGPGTYTINGYSIIISTPGISALMYDVSIDELTGYTLFPYDTTPTAESTRPVTSGGVKTALDGKIDKVLDALTGEIPVFDGDGGLEGSNKSLSDLATKEDIAVLAGEAGLAEAVIDTDGAGTEQQFTFRKSGGDGGAYYRKIKGKTLAWNQLAVRANPSSEVYGITRTANGNALHYSGTSTNSTNFTGTQALNFKASHKYYYVGIGIPSTCGISPIAGASVVGVNAYIYQAPQDEQRSFGVYIPSGVSIDNDVLFVCRDLTQMFGAGNEPSTVEEFEALYAPSYDTINPGTLISNDAEAVETTGANQWDEEFIDGYYDTQNGQFLASNAWKANKNPIFVVPNAIYYNHKDGSTFVVLCYDKSGNYLGYLQPGGNAGFTPIIGTSYINFYCQTNTTYICINIFNPAINGQYFPYWKRILQLGITTRKDTDGNVPFADGMKGAGTASDWADKVGGEKRMGSLDLGSLNWGYRTPAYPYFYSAVQSQIKKPATNGTVPNIICAKYVTTDANSPYGGSPSVCITMNTDGEIIIYDPSFGSDTDALKAALSGVMLDYELATPVPFTWAEPLNLGVKVDENGTERAVAPEGTTEPSAPFVADTTYTMSIQRIVQKLAAL